MLLLILTIDLDFTPHTIIFTLDGLKRTFLPTLLLTTFLLVSTVYMKTLDFSVNLECYKVFITTNWTNSFFDIVQTRLTESTTHSGNWVRISTGKVAYFTYKMIALWCISKTTITSTDVVHEECTNFYLKTASVSLDFLA